MLPETFLYTGSVSFQFQVTIPAGNHLFDPQDFADRIICLMVNEEAPSDEEMEESRCRTLQMQRTVVYTEIPTPLEELTPEEHLAHEPDYAYLAIMGEQP